MSGTRGSLAERGTRVCETRGEDQAYISTQIEPAIGKRPLTTMQRYSTSDARSGDRQGPGPAARTRSKSRNEGSIGWIDALTIALGQASEGKWYVSTLELQLASFQVCAACRGVLTLRVTVRKYMPLSLWGDNGSLGDPLKPTTRRRLPALRAAGVEWNMPTVMLGPLLSRAALLREVEWMQLSGVDYGHLEPNDVAKFRSDNLSQPATQLGYTPRRYFEAMRSFLKDPEDGNDPVLDMINGKGRQIDTMHNLGRVSWPSALRQLSLFCQSGDHIDWTALPNSLQRLALGGCFDQPIESVTWPVSLKHLTLGGSFRPPITDVVWPASLLHLTFGRCFNQPITDVVWPPYLQRLVFGLDFNQPIADVIWPASLLRLAFGEDFDQPITGVTWPASLQKLAFGSEFDQPIADVVWPASLKGLVFGYCFNHPITEAVWPIALESLTFGDAFDQPIEGIAWPASLQCLTFSDDFIDDLDLEVWTPVLEDLIFWNEFDNRDDGSDWPPGEDEFDQPRMKSMGYF